MPASARTVAQLWADILTLSALKPNERVIVLNRMGGAGCYRDVAIEAARAAGADAIYLEAPSTDALPATALAALAKADLVIDLAFAHDPAVQTLLAGGARFLVVLEPPEILARMFPAPDDKRRVQAATTALAAAPTFRATTPAGTDFRAALGQYRVIGQYGFADEAGHWDQWPGAFALTYPNERSAEGRVAIAPGDMIFPYKTYVQSPIMLEIEAGFIRAIEGGTDAAYMRDYLAAYDDPDVYAVSHIGWGLDHRAEWSALGRYDKAVIEGQDGRAFYGNFLFSTGPNVTGGGARTVPCHLDIPLRGASVWAGDVQIVRDGAVLPQDQRVESGAGHAERVMF